MSKVKCGECRTDAYHDYIHTLQMRAQLVWREFLVFRDLEVEHARRRFWDRFDMIDLLWRSVVSKGRKTNKSILCTGRRKCDEPSHLRKRKNVTGDACAVRLTESGRVLIVAANRRKLIYVEPLACTRRCVPSTRRRPQAQGAQLVLLSRAGRDDEPLRATLRRRVCVMQTAGVGVSSGNSGAALR